jgi:hypothetical protein
MRGGKPAADPTVGNFGQANYAAAVSVTDRAALY